MSPRVSGIKKDGFVNEKIEMQVSHIMANCSSWLLGLIVRNTFHVIPVVLVVPLKIKKDLSEVAGWE